MVNGAEALAEYHRVDSGGLQEGRRGQENGRFVSTSHTQSRPRCLIQWESSRLSCSHRSAAHRVCLVLGPCPAQCCSVVITGSRRTPQCNVPPGVQNSPPTKLPRPVLVVVVVVVVVVSGSCSCSLRCCVLKIERPTDRWHRSALIA